MLKRKPEAILVAHRMDSCRKELYVEGLSDKLLLRWVVGKRIDANTSIVEIALVDLPESIPGGERGRLLHFAEWLGTDAAQIRMFADADWDRLLGRPTPGRVWLTDFRDMEGYVSCERCIDKVLALGIKTDKISATQLITMIRTVGRLLGFMRLMSELDGLQLPFQRTHLKGHVSMTDLNLTFSVNDYLRALLQNAEISLSTLPQMEARLAEIGSQFAAVPDDQLVHGKDALKLLDIALAPFGVKPEESHRIVWVALEDLETQAYPEFGKVVSFLVNQANT